MKNDRTNGAAAAEREWYQLLYGALLAETGLKVPMRLESDPHRGCSIGIVCGGVDEAANVAARLREVADALERGVERLAGIGVHSIDDLRSTRRDADVRLRHRGHRPEGRSS